MKVKIPTKFKLFGMTIHVHYDPKLLFEDGSHGQAKFKTMEIILQSPTEGAPINQKLVEHSFFHELVHHIFDLAGDDNIQPSLSSREYLVDRVAGLLHQAFATAEYDESEEKKTKE